MIDLILHQMGITPEKVQQALATFIEGARSMKRAEARLERIEIALGITEPLPEIEEANNGTGNKRDTARNGTSADRNSGGIGKRR